ncbi:MAG: hypothetical protein HZA20_13775 [Nitrospirae bacterium]|nr:hypothetical protein [Nitrospirota bacterium]
MAGCLFLALSFLLVFSTSSHALFGFGSSEETPKGSVLTPQECKLEFNNRKKQIRTEQSVDLTAANIASVFGSIHKTCSYREELFQYALRKGKYDNALLSGIGRALYEGAIFGAINPDDDWKMEARKADLRQRMLGAADALLERYKAEKIPYEKYADGIRPMIGFARLQLDSRSSSASGDYGESKLPSEIPVDELELLAHSPATMFVYFNYYSDNGILGNYRNFETMRTSLDKFLSDAEDACEFILTLSSGELRVLDLGFGLQIQAAVEGLAAPSKQTTSSPAFIRDPSTGQALPDPFLMVPATHNAPYRTWLGGYAYILKPEPSSIGENKTLAAVIDKERTAKPVSPRMRVLQLLGKVKPEEEPPKTETVTAKFDKPRVYRIISYISSEKLRELENSCGTRLNNLIAIP